MKLEPQTVSDIFTKCLFQEGEDTYYSVVAEGIMMTVGFNPVRLAQHKSEIRSLLEELPAEFQEKSGGGMSFLNACMDRHGNQWTGMHQTMEQLFLLGLATGDVICLLPREVWEALPGGMPYYEVKAEEPV